MPNQSMQNAPDEPKYAADEGVDPAPVITPRLQRLLRLLDHVISFGGRLVVLTGVRRVGKTTLLEELLRTRRQSEAICYMVALREDTPAQVLAEVCDEFSIQTPSQAEQADLLAALDKFLLAAAPNEQHLIVLDNAHCLNNTVLTLLADLALRYQGVLQVILCGEPALNNRLQALAVVRANGQLLYHQPLEGFTLEECEHYIREHLSKPSSQQAPFSHADCAAIWRDSGGLPGRIRDQLQQPRPAQRTHHLRNRLLIGGGVAVGVMVLGLLAVFIVRTQLMPPALSPPMTLTPPSEPLRMRPIERDQTERMATAAQSAEIPTKQPPDSQSAPPRTDTDVVVPPAEDSDTQPRKEAAADELETPEEAETPRPQSESVAEATAPQNAAEPLETETLHERAANEQEILSLDPDAYTIQLFGAYQEETITSLLAELPADRAYRYFRTEHKGAPWYVLIYGSYTRRAEALAAAAELPKRLNPEAAWIRSVDGIQQDLLQRRKQ